MIELIIPTHNRNLFLKRILHYYDNHASGLTVTIIDSSKEPVSSSNYGVVESLSGKNCYNYIHSSQFTNEDILLHEKVRHGLNRSVADYVAVCADDDFLVPTALEKFASFLEQNPDYCCAKGRIFDFIAPKKGVFRLLPALHWRPVESEDACERVWLASRYYQQSFYGLFRLETLQEIQRSMPQRFLRHPGWLDELSFSTFAAAMGKIMRFDCPHEYRELHDSNFGHIVSKWPETTFEEELRPFVTDYSQALRDLLLRHHPELEEAAGNKAAQSSLIAFSKWYYDTRYRDSHNRPRGIGTLEHRDMLQSLMEKTMESHRWVKSEYQRQRAMRFPETKAVMAAIAEYHGGRHSVAPSQEPSC